MSSTDIRDLGSHASRPAKEIADTRNRNRTDVTITEGIVTTVRRSINANGDVEDLDDGRRILPSLYKDEKDDTSLDIAMPLGIRVEKMTFPRCKSDRPEKTRGTDTNPDVANAKHWHSWDRTPL